MLVYFYLIFLLYYLFVLLMILGWTRGKHRVESRQNDFSPSVSVVIAVRNEEKDIAKLMYCLAAQTCKPQEIIIVDDQSEDRTADFIGEGAEKYWLPVTLLNAKKSFKTQGSPKKAALMQGVSQSTGQILVFTDGDCTMDENWLQTMIAPFEQEEISFVSGPVAIAGGAGIWSKLQSMEFCSLMGAGAATLRLGYPLMCNGANIAVRREAFFEVNGYEGTNDQATGDDVFLMQKIFIKNPEGLFFNQNKDAVVWTGPAETTGALVNQRTRWASKWRMPLLPMGWVLPVFLFGFYVSFLLCLPVFAFAGLVGYGLLLFTLKLAVDFIFLKKVMQFCNRPMHLHVFIIAELLYPFYAIFVGIRVHFFSWQWKGRTFKK